MCALWRISDGICVCYLSCLTSSDFWWVRCLSGDQLTESCSVRICLLHEICIVSKASVSLLLYIHFSYSGALLSIMRFQMVMLVKEDPLLVDVIALEKWYEWGTGHEDALHQLRATEVSGLPAGTWWKPGCPVEEVTSSLWSFLLRQSYKWSHENIFFFCPSLLKGRDSDGFPQYLEKFIHDCIRTFPYCEATLLQQLVRSIVPVEIVSTIWNI